MASQGATVHESTFPEVEGTHVIVNQIPGLDLEGLDILSKTGLDQARLERYAELIRENHEYLKSQTDCFQSLGGTVRIGVIRVTDDEESIFPEPGPNGYPDATGPLMARQIALLRPGDIVVPVCHDGMNRSQVMHCLLEAVARLSAQAWPNKPKIAVMPPHGAETGCDPHIAYKDLTEDNYFGYRYSPINPSSAPSEWQHRCHRAVFGRDKLEIIGLKALRGSGRIHSINYTYDSGVPISTVERTRQAQREHMNITLYNPEWLRGWAYQYEPAGVEAGAAGGAAAGGTSGTGASDGAAVTSADASSLRRIVYVCFMRGGPIVIRRLIEAGRERGNGASSKPLSRVCVVCLPLDDNISRAGAEHNLGTLEAEHKRYECNQLAIKRTLEQYSRIVRPILPVTEREAIDSIRTRLAKLCGAGSSQQKDPE